jgi:hypothetical protein
MLGLESVSKTTENMRRTGEMVINLPFAAPGSDFKWRAEWHFERRR